MIELMEFLNRVELSVPGIMSHSTKYAIHKTVRAVHAGTFWLVPFGAS